MRRGALLLALLLLAGGGWHLWRRVGRPPGPPASPPEELTLVRTRFRDLEFAVPAEWAKESSELGEIGVMFFGPREEGFRANVMFYWLRGGRDPERFLRDRRLAIDGQFRPPEKVIEAPATVAGMVARRFLYTLNDPTGIYRVVDYVFAGPRGAGMLRGTSLVSSAARHTALFDALAAQVRLDPEPSK